MRVLAPALLVLSLGLAACASGRDPGATSDSDAEAERGDAEIDGSCPRRGMVTVLVDNRSSFDIWIAFGPWRPARAATGFARTTYAVSRSYLENYDITVGIERGGLAVRPPAQVQTEWVICNDATLVIGSRPEYSFFYGDRLWEPVRETDEKAGDDDGAAPADSAASPSDSAAAAGDSGSRSSAPEPPEGE